MSEQYVHDFQNETKPLSSRERILKDKIDDKMDGVSPSEYDAFVLDRKRDVMANISRKKLEEFLDDEKKYVGLELGVGTGIYTEALNHIENLELLGLEIRKDLVDYGVSKSRFKEGQIVIGDFHKLPFADDSFELVTGLAITRQRENIDDFYAEIKRVLREDGLFFIPFIKSKSGIIDREVQTIIDQGFDIVEKGDWYIVAKK